MAAVSVVTLVLLARSRRREFAADEWGRLLSTHPPTEERIERLLDPPAERASRESRRIDP